MNKINKGILIISLLAGSIGANAQNLRTNDSKGIGMAIAAMIVIFVSLIFFYFVFRIIANISIQLSNKNTMKVKGITDKNQATGPESGDVLAAISMALHEYQDNVHDVEDMVLTINKVKRNYSPWSSKIYTLTETPRKR